MKLMGKVRHQWCAAVVRDQICPLVMGSAKTHASATPEQDVSVHLNFAKPNLCLEEQRLPVVLFVKAARGSQRQPKANASSILFIVLTIYIWLLSFWSLSDVWAGNLRWGRSNLTPFGVSHSGQPTRLQPSWRKKTCWFPADKAEKDRSSTLRLICLFTMQPQQEVNVWISPGS